MFDSNYSEEGCASDEAGEGNSLNSIQHQKESLCAWLNTIGLVEIYSPLLKCGYNSLELLSHCKLSSNDSNDDIEKIATELKLSMAQKLKFRKGITELLKKTQSNSNINEYHHYPTPVAPTFIPGNANNNNMNNILMNEGNKVQMQCKNNIISIENKIKDLITIKNEINSQKNQNQKEIHLKFNKILKCLQTRQQILFQSLTDMNGRKLEEIENDIKQYELKLIETKGMYKTLNDNKYNYSLNAENTLQMINERTKVIMNIKQQIAINEQSIYNDNKSQFAFVMDLAVDQLIENINDFGSVVECKIENKSNSINAEMKSNENIHQPGIKYDFWSKNESHRGFLIHGPNKNKLRRMNEFDGYWFNAFGTNVISAGMRVVWTVNILKKEQYYSSVSSLIGIIANSKINKLMNNWFANKVNNGYGMYLLNGNIHHSNEYQKYAVECKIKDCVKIVLDMSGKPCTLNFMINGKDYGLAFEIEPNCNYKLAVAMLYRDEIEIIQS